jgi:hypothetical protein
MNPAPANDDGTTPSAARMLDYLLGDGRNFAADRRLAEVLRRAVPDITVLVQVARSFMRRAVTHVAAAGVRQFLDLSIGTTAVGNVHEVARAVDPTCRVVYVHADPISVVHTKQLLAGVERTAVLHASPRDSGKIMAACRDGGLLDLAAPVGLLMVTGLGMLPGSTNMVKMMTRYRRSVVAGSHLVICHLTSDRRPAESATLVEVMKASQDPVQPRTRDEVVSLFSGFDLLPPGVVDPGHWHVERPLDPTEQAAAAMVHVGVGRKPKPA